MKAAAKAALTLGLTAMILGGCTYREIRPSSATQEAELSGVVRFGGISFQQLAPNVWQHTSYLDLPGFGAVPSNGLIVIDGDTSILVDTAWTVPQTDVIVAWTASELDRPIRAAIVTHAHSDKMGGMDALHRANIATFAHPMSNQIAPSNNLLPAMNALRFGADGWAENPAGGVLGPLRIYYPGPGHTDDNITLAITGTDIAFGGCLIKGSQSATLGNLAEADTGHYAQAVENFSAAFPNSTMIAMSHSAAENRGAIKQTLKLAKQL